MNESDRVLTVSEALQIISPFFVSEWPNTSEKDVSIEQISGGFVNTLHLVSRSSIAQSEPCSVVVRHFGQTSENDEPSSGSATLSATEQALICYEMGRKGWGPKLYGTFQGGRVEEFIDSHTLTAAESMDSVIRKDIARSYARLHSLVLPFRKSSHEHATSRMTESLTKKDVLIEGLLQTDDGQEAKDLAGMISSSDWAAELDWVSSLFTRHECKMATVVGDNNYLNVLVRNCDSECQVMLVDYETATYNYRGIDIGGHFLERQYCWSSSTSNVTGFPPPDIDEQRSFCRSYLEEEQGLVAYLTAADTVEHLLIESHIGQLYQILFSISLCFQDGEPEGLTWAGSMTGLNQVMQSYLELKQQFLDSYSACSPD